MPKFNHTIENIQRIGTGLITGTLKPDVNYGPINFERESNPYTTLAIKFQPYIGGIAPYISYGKTFTLGQHTVYDKNSTGMSLNNDEPPKYIRIPTGSSINTGVEINMGKSLRLNMEFGQTKFPEKKFTLPTRRRCCVAWEGVKTPHLVMN